MYTGRCACVQARTRNQGTRPLKRTDDSSALNKHERRDPPRGSAACDVPQVDLGGECRCCAREEVEEKTAPTLCKLMTSHRTYRSTVLIGLMYLTFFGVMLCCLYFNARRLGVFLSIRSLM